MPPRYLKAARLPAHVLRNGIVTAVLAAFIAAAVAVPGANAKRVQKPHIQKSGVQKTAAAKPLRRKPIKVARPAAAPKSAAKTRLAAKPPPPEDAPAVPEAPALAAAVPIKLLSREEILSYDRDALERVGRHLVVGYHSLAAIRELVEQRAIAGVFITDHNVRGRTAADVKDDIDALQEIRKEQALPPLIIAADQEGGTVSRLSPPLKRQTSLARTLTGLKDDAARQDAVEAYAETQAGELQRIGVTLNFAPVVDLNFNPANRSDGETRLRWRAIAADPYLVSKVGAWYCDGLARAGLMCTLKHFPGLGRVSRDTHVASGEIAASEGQLELNDWVPFRRLMSKPNAATMLGHVRVGVIDKSTPASFSKPVIADLIRGRWQYDGLLITDDFSMGAIVRSKTGAGKAAVQSLNAGTDLVLVSYSELHYDAVMSALLAADADGSLGREALSASTARIARVLDASSWTKPD